MDENNKYLNEIKMNVIDIELRSKEEIKQKVIIWDNEQWTSEIETKSSLLLYRNFKDKIQEEDIYDNRPSSTILCKARSNTLPLNDRNRHKNKETHCIACGNIDQQEDIYHFILHCPAYIKERANIIQLQQPYIQDDAEIIGNFLFEKLHLDQKKEGLYQLWKARNRLLDTKKTIKTYL